MSNIKRNNTRQINVGGVMIGGSAPIVIQSMTNTKTTDIDETVAQINRLEQAGCAIVRCSVYDKPAAEAIKEIKKRVKSPIVADIHFDYRLAIAAMENGCDKVRINPGNIGDTDRVRAVLDAAKSRNVPIRLGVNSGSLEADILRKYGAPTAAALVESAIRNIEFFEDCGFFDIVLSIKSSSVLETISAYEMISKQTDYPLHIGVTEAGTAFAGGIKSAIGIGSLLAHGIGDTIRVSLTGDPVTEIRYAREILKSLGYKGFGATVISCPTCARSGMDIEKLANDVEMRLAGINRDITVAVMGCAVNGPGEAKDADIGIAAGDKCGIIFVKGEIIGKFAEDVVVDEMMKLL